MHLHLTNHIHNKNADDFNGNHQNSNIFQSIEMFNFYESVPKLEPVFLTVLNESNNIVATMLAVLHREHKGFLGNFSARSIIIGGPLVKENNEEILNYLLSEYNKIIKKKAIYSQFRNLWNWSEKEKEIFEGHGFKFEEHLDIMHDLNISQKELLSNMHKGRRKNVRRAEKVPLEFSLVKEKSDFNKCLLLIKKTYDKVGLPCPDKSFFLKSKEMLTDSSILKMFAAKYKKDVIACRFVLCYNGLIYDWYAGADESHLDKYPNDFLPYRVMEWGIENNFDKFDFGGAGKPNKPYGVRDFKLKFGGELVNYGRFEKIHKPFFMRLGKLGIFLLKKFK